MTKQTDKQQKNYKRIMFFLISVAFTILSMYNGFGWYKAWYGITIAAMISVSVELSSIALFFYVLYVVFRKSHIFMIAIIIILRFACGMVNYTAFAHDIQTEYTKSTKEMYSKVQKVLPEYGKYVQGLLKAQEKDVAENILLKNKIGNEKGFDELNAFRLKEFNEEKANLQKIYEITPQNIINYREHVVRMGAKIDSKQNFDISDVSDKENALKSIWPVKPDTINKIVGAFYSGMIEIMILASILMGYFSQVQKSTQKSTAKKKQSTIDISDNHGPSESTKRKWIEYKNVHGEWKPRGRVNAKWRNYYDEFILREHPEILEGK